MDFINRSLFGNLSGKSRQKKMEILNSTFPIDASTSVLDLGGQVDEISGQIIESHPKPESITVVNLLHEHLAEVRRQFPRVSVCNADARRLPFEDNSFDVVYSNAVIEHVGGLEDQQAMAKEVMRVGRTWFITTPNRWYPFEFHTRLPFVSWLPAPMMKRVMEVWSYNHIQQCYQSGIRGRQIRLLTARGLKNLFPNSRVVHCRITMWPETLIVIGSTA